MKFITLFAGALVATTAANVLLASDAYAVSLPNGWTQVGQSCRPADYKPHWGASTQNPMTPQRLIAVYYKLVKSGTTQYGIWNGAGTGYWLDSEPMRTWTGETGWCANCANQPKTLATTTTQIAFNNKNLTKEEANTKMNLLCGISPCGHTKCYQPALLCNQLSTTTYDPPAFPPSSNCPPAWGGF